MRLDIFSRIERIFPYPDELSVDDEIAIENEFGADAVMKIRSLSEDSKISKDKFSAELDVIKQSILKHKRDKDYIFGKYDNFFKYFSLQEVKELVIQLVVDEQMFELYDPDGMIIDLLCAYTTNEFERSNGEKVKVKGSSVEPMREDFKKIIQQYIKHGYNPYPLMNSINAKCLNSQDKEEKAQGWAINQLLENCERTFSPYQKVFKSAEHLGELINKSKEVEKKGEFEEMEKVDQEISNYQDKIKKTLDKSDFDLVELEEVLSGKSKYVKESEKGFNHESVNYDMYQGLLAMKKVVHFEHKKALDSQSSL